MVDITDEGSLETFSTQSVGSNQIYTADPEVRSYDPQGNLQYAFFTPDQYKFNTLAYDECDTGGAVYTGSAARPDHGIRKYNPDNKNDLIEENLLSPVGDYDSVLTDGNGNVYASAWRPEDPPERVNVQKLDSNLNLIWENVIPYSFASTGKDRELVTAVDEANTYYIALINNDEILSFDKANGSASVVGSPVALINNVIAASGPGEVYSFGGFSSRNLVIRKYVNGSESWQVNVSQQHFNFTGEDEGDAVDLAVGPNKSGELFYSFQYAREGDDVFSQAIVKIDESDGSLIEKTHEETGTPLEKIFVDNENFLYYKKEIRPFNEGNFLFYKRDLDTTNNKVIFEKDVADPKFDQFTVEPGEYKTKYGSCSSSSVNPSLDVSTLSADNISINEATLNGSLDSLTDLPDADVYFKWGTTTSFGNTTATQNLTQAQNFSKTITGLNQGTTYYFQAVAKSGNLPEETGSTESFTIQEPDGSVAFGEPSEDGNSNAIKTFFKQGSLAWENTEIGITTAVGAAQDGVIYNAEFNQIRKTDQNGNTVWVYDGPSDSTEFAFNEIIVSPNGNPYAKYLDDRPSTREYGVQKISTDGTQVLWNNNFGTSTNSLECLLQTGDLVVSVEASTTANIIDSSSGNVYNSVDFVPSAGSIVNDIVNIKSDTNNDLYGAYAPSNEPGQIIKASTSGNIIWSYTLNAEAFGLPMGVNRQGNVYFANQGKLKKLSQDGTQIEWVKSASNVSEIIVGSSGFLYTTDEGTDATDRPDVDRRDPSNGDIITSSYGEGPTNKTYDVVPGYYYRTFDTKASFSYTGNSLSFEDVIVGPTGMTFSDTGTKLFLTDGISGNEKVIEYQLDAPFDISSKSVNQIFSQNIEAPESIRFNQDGSEMFILESDIGIKKFTLSSNFDLSSTVNLDNTTQVDEDTYFDFSNDGEKLLTLTQIDSAVTQYSLSAPFDVSSKGTQASVFDFTNEGEFPNGITLEPDDLKLYMVGADTDKFIYEYDMENPADISTMSYSGNKYSVSDELQDSNNEPIAVSFNSIGTKMFVLIRVNSIVTRIYEYNI